MPTKKEIQANERFFRDPEIGEGQLKPPAVGTACSNLRKALNLLGYKISRGDQYDERLVAAVHQFQLDYQYTPTHGFVDTGTRRLLTQVIVQKLGKRGFSDMKVPEERSKKQSPTHLTENVNVSMLKTQMQLMLVWVIGAAFLVVIAWLQIMFGHYGENGSDVIAWLLSLIIPTVSLVTGVWANNTIRRSKSKRQVEKKTYWLVLAVSFFYLLFIGLVFAIQPMVARPPLDVIKDSRVLLSSLQGVVSVFLGIFFTQEPKSKS
jgi:hypothetical protein